MKKGKYTKTQDPTGWGDSTKLIRGGLTRSEFGETAEALYLTSGYVYDDPESAERRFSGEEEGYVYGRYGNPTVTMLEERFRMLEGAEAAYAVASGMAACWGSLACQLKSGDHIVASKSLFGSNYQILTVILPRFGITATLVDGNDLSAWKAAIRPETKILFFETPSNPLLEVLDIEAISDIAHKAGAQVVIDNVFATPLLQKPMELGADIVFYSNTKHTDGQGRVFGGMILSTAKFKEELLKPFLRHTGPTLSPFNAWVLLKGLETMKLRVNASSHSAEYLANSLDGMPSIERVYYPHHDTHPQVRLAKKQMKLGGTMVSFDVKGGKEGAFNLLRRLRIIDISNNLGDSKSLITHPATTTHKNIGPEARALMGISDGCLRLSVGLEDASDLLADLKQAMAVNS
ncbi:O-succinylhomoserine sulfhydrylase [Aestuariivirga litoralis]|uniref:O-succinylhomoserine sulfhydrylase n=1 Tax=Aestuariivirga litoralis TaxID=2650924 RepID=UPI0018C6460D|nr:O-succinylhomoserine sulfhydrylase [Aestuariivirga litoralis]MBG1231594.1 O-succinylhomoserine sulfhydrylase [Aestuariivirga litoralis]